MTKLRLEANNLEVSYGPKKVVRDVSMVLRAGEIVGLVGPNGAGKSSLIRALAGLQPADAGSVQVLNVDVFASPQQARGVIGMVPQDVALFDELSAEETLLLAGRLRNLEGDVLRDEVRRWLTLAELTHVGQAMSKYYSGGMRRKLALGATLIGAPPVLLLDESFAGLDPEATAAIEQELLRHRAAGAAILLCSHRMELLERIADRVVMIQNGAISEELTRAGITQLQEQAGESLLDWYLNAVRRGRDNADASAAAAQVESAPAGAQLSGREAPALLADHSDTRDGDAGDANALASSASDSSSTSGSASSSGASDSGAGGVDG